MMLDKRPPQAAKRVVPQSFKRFVSWETKRFLYIENVFLTFVFCAVRTWFVRWGKCRFRAGARRKSIQSKGDAWI